MKRDRLVQLRLLRQLREGAKDPSLDDLPDDLVCYNAALLIEDGHIKGVARKGSDRRYSSAKLTAITSSGHDLLESLEKEFNAPTMKVEDDDSEALKVFISHASADADVAEKLAKLLCFALSLPPEDIRCTSVDGFRFPVGAAFGSQIRREVVKAKALVGIITPVSIRSPYVLFELGARWGTKFPLFPVLACGATPVDLEGPLQELNVVSLSKATDVFQLLDEIAETVGAALLRPAVLSAEIDKLCSVSQLSKPKPDEPTVSTGMSADQFDHDTRTGWYVHRKSLTKYCPQCMLEKPPTYSPLVDQKGDGGWQCMVSGCKGYFPTIEKQERSAAESQARAERGRAMRRRLIY
ncbi:MAG: toll/interleukin-1 receptor domain-containing protein [Verrucomicrobiaceae bacterium]|nr:toll/interleukin-1 receptor domain-containing protein [Verrucomicrobiaceae bacterium]